MNDIALPLIDDAPTTQPARFLPLAPLGLGTGLQESFASYITRLSVTHGLNSLTFLKEEVCPRVPIEWSKAKVFVLSPRTDLLLSKGDSVCDRLADRIAEMTGLPEVFRLRHQFLDLDLRLWFSTLRSFIAWCPSCIKDWRASEQPVYFPLAWAAKCVRCCPDHGTLLVNACPSCGLSFLHLEARAWKDTCRRCGCSLLDVAPAQASDWERRVADIVCDFVAWSGGLTAAPAFRWQSNIRTACLVLGRDGLAAAIGLTLANVGSWLYPSSPARPSLTAFIRLSLSFGIPISNWLSQDLFPEAFAKPERLPVSIPCLAPKIPFPTKEKVEHQLRAALVEANPRSVAGIARGLGIDVAAFNRSFPALCKQVSARYVRFVRVRRLHKDTARATLVREAMAHFESMGEPFCVSRARAFLGDRWKESVLQLDLVYRRVVKGDPAYAWRVEDLPKFE